MRKSARLLLESIPGLLDVGNPDIPAYNSSMPPIYSLAGTRSVPVNTPPLRRDME